MIKAYIERLVGAHPAEISAAQNAVDLLMPYAMLAALLWAVWQLLRMFDRWLDRSEARRAAKTQDPHYRTADGEQIKRETAQIWAPWHDTMPPAQEVPRRPNRVRAGPPTVIQFPSADAERRRQQS